MTFELIASVDFLFGKRNPVIYAVLRLDVIVEKRIGKAIVLKLNIRFPAVVWIKKLVAIVSQSAGMTLRTAK